MNFPIEFPIRCGKKCSIEIQQSGQPSYDSDKSPLLCAICAGCCTKLNTFWGFEKSHCAVYANRMHIRTRHVCIQLLWLRIYAVSFLKCSECGGKVKKIRLWLIVSYFWNVCGHRFIKIIQFESKWSSSVTVDLNIPNNFMITPCKHESLKLDANRSAWLITETLRFQNIFCLFLAESCSESHLISVQMDFMQK